MIAPCVRKYSLTAERQFPKLKVRVRLPLFAPYLKIKDGMIMANNCLFDIKITGEFFDVKELCEMISEHQLGRVFSFDLTTDIERTSVENIYSVLGCGDCAWSVLCAMRKDYCFPSLESESERLNLVIELFSAEPGIGFQEHVLIKKGLVEIDEVEDYAECWLDDYKNVNDINRECGTRFTDEDVNENGVISEGGIDNYGVFEDLEIYFENCEVGI